MTPLFVMTLRAAPEVKVKPSVRHAVQYLLIAALLLLQLSACVIVEEGHPSRVKVHAARRLPSHLYVERDEYDPHSYNDGIGDPMALQLAPPDSGPVSYGGVHVAQACNVLSVDDVRQLGLRTRANQLDGSFERNFFDGSGRGVLRPSLGGLPGPDESNFCNYLLEDGGFVGIDVYQRSYVTEDALSAEISRRYERAGVAGGFNVFSREQDGMQFDMLEKAGAATHVQSRGLSSEMRQRVLEVVAANLGRELQSPAGAPSVRYESPLVRAPVADACSLLTAESAEVALGGLSSPLVTESAATSIGVLRFSSGIVDNFVSMACERRVVKSDVDIQTFSMRAVQLRVLTFSSVEASEAEIDGDAAFNESFAPVSGVGDEAIFGVDVAGTPVLHVRQGRFVLEMGVQSKRSQATKEQVVQTLVTLGQAATARLDNG